MSKKLIVPKFYICDTHHGEFEIGTKKPSTIGDCSRKEAAEKHHQKQSKRWGGSYSRERFNPTCSWSPEADWARKTRIRDFKRAHRVWAPLFDNIWFHGTGKKIMLRHYCIPKDSREGKDVSEWLRWKKERGGRLEPGGLIAKKRRTGWVGHREDRYYTMRQGQPHLRAFHMAEYGEVHCGNCSKVFGTREEVEAKVREFASKIDKKTLAALSLFLRV